jgi:Tfp pilus assembly protein PilW
MRNLTLLSTLRSEQGAMLLELLVAMIIATVIMIAMVALLIFTTTQTSRVSERVETDRLGRMAMARITDELHSSCTGFGTNAIQGPGTSPVSPLESTGPLNLWFVSAYGSSTSREAVEKTVYEHDIHWTASKAGATTGTLTDYSFESLANTGPGTTAGQWEFPTLNEANAKKRVLATNVIPLSISGANTIFQYYELTESSAFAQLTSNIPAEAKANNIVKVSINFTQAPASGQTKLARAASFSDAVVLRLNPTETGEDVQNEPCS